jgi:hypothetical protein
MKFRPSLVILQIMIVTLLCLTTLPQSLAFRYYSDWASYPINISVDENGLTSILDDDHGVTATIQAITAKKAWNGAIAGIITAQAAKVQGISGDGRVTINFRDPDSICSGTCIATTVPLVSESHYIIDADIFTNVTVAFTSKEETDGCAEEFAIEAIMVHEVGHVLGLLHALKVSSTMYATTYYCLDQKAAITRDDAKGILALYQP